MVAPVQGDKLYMHPSPVQIILQLVAASILLSLIDVKHCSGRRPLLLPGAPSIHRFSLLRCADLPLRSLQPIARQVQLQDYAVMNEAVDGRRRRHRVFEDPLPLLIGMGACSRRISKATQMGKIPDEST